jgi:uncharacterized membrane protein YoaT (DUF817 family)
MKKEVKRYVIRSRWCNHAIAVLLLFAIALTYSLNYDIRLMPMAISLLIIEVMLLIQTVHIIVYEEKEG